MPTSAAIEIEEVASVDTARRVPTFVLPLVRTLVIAADAVIAGVAFVLAFWLRQNEAALSTTAWAWSREFVPYAGIFYFALVIVPPALAYQRVYRFQGPFAVSNDITRIFKAVFVASLLITAWAFLFRGGFEFREFSYSRAVFILNFFILLTLLLVFHCGIRLVQSMFRRKGINLIPAIVVGENAEAENTIAELEKRADLGYRVIGVLRTDESSQSRSVCGKPVIGDFSQLADLVREYDIREVIITESRVSSDRLFEAMMQIGRKGVEFRYAPSLFELLPQKTSVDQIGVLPMVRLFREPLSDGSRFVKRISDLMLAIIAITVTLPIWIVSAIAVKLGSRGPILFKQERVGMDGRVFLCYKFRTMRADADDSAHRAAYKQNIESVDVSRSDSNSVYGKVDDDTRITPVGKWLRRTSIDELPQFLNVIRGDMSVVGPRPPIPYEVEEYELRHRKRLDMKPGISGLWQVSGRSTLPFEEMVRIDLYYIENWSLLLDAKIILQTIPAIIRGDGAR